MKILEKLKKLIAHEKSARSIGNIAEAEVFAGKIQELLDNHNLSLSDIDIENAKSSVTRSSNNLHAINGWQRLFIANIAEINGCIVVYAGTEITLIGTEVDRLIVFEIYDYFTELAKVFADANWKEWKNTIDYRRKRKKIYHSKLYKTSYLLGFVSALIGRFKEQHEQSKTHSSNSNALIFIGNKLADANQWIETNIKTTVKNTSKIKWSKLKYDAFNNGMKDGNSVALTTQTIS